MAIEFTGTTGSKSTFTIEQPTTLRLRLMLNSKPLKNEPCAVSFDGAAPVKLSTDGDAFLEAPIPQGAKLATVALLQHKHVEHTVRLGKLAPVDTTAGQKARLRQLGYNCGKGGRTSDDELALRNFQKRHGLEESGTLDGPTKDALVKAYGH